MNATSYRYRNARLRKRVIESVIALAFTMAVLFAVVGSLAANASTHAGCAARSISTMSDVCSRR